MIRPTLRLSAALALLLAGAAAAQEPDAVVKGSPRVEALLQKMTLEEKVGQLNLLSIVPKHEPSFQPLAQAMRDGAVGGFFNVHGAAETRDLQKTAIESSRLGIPLFLALDVVHGYRTVFPTPLGQAASWDLAAIERSERIASVESAAGGVNMILSPMLDITRDPRWGRVVEGGGESPWLVSRIAEARVKGFQGAAGLNAPDATVACVKHFGANGAVEGGRDYTAADLSERSLRETYLPPFRAAVEAGAVCMMAAFNAPDGLPSIANGRLLTDILRREWGFDGAVMSDFEAIDEMLLHGFAADEADAAKLAFDAGADIDMQSKAYRGELPALVRDDAVSNEALDVSVRRVLTLKEKLGLFDDPYRGLDPAKEKAVLFAEEHKTAALDLAEKSLVLLKNENKLLPFPAGVKKVALIGPLGDGPADTLGPWAARGEPSETITLKRGLEQRLGSGVELAFTPGGTIDASRADEIAAAVETARRAEVVVLAVGERFNQSGEGASRSDLGLPGDQAALVGAILALGKPTVAVVFAGRPLVLTDLDKTAPAILYAWQPGSMGGLAIARTLMGDVSPSGRLPMSFPRAVGQVPVHHDRRPTGRPATIPPKPYTANYSDVSHLPLYPFGFGLTYTDLAYGKPRLDKTELKAGETVTVSVDVTNSGRREGAALVQLYLRPLVARAARPLMELRGFSRVTLKPGETRTVTLPVGVPDFSYWRDAETFEALPGPIEVMTGGDAADVKSTRFEFRG